MSGEAPVQAVACEHRVRTREIHWGFASAETICAACGQVFDLEREQDLRERDRGLPADRETAT
ncbi:MAG TPA: hypothetical protein VE441_02195 [Mycobacterium sp.]|jgi:hypothetical protein|nr:hypothetical protein [Mycobacterium sp.]